MPSEDLFTELLVETVWKIGIAPSLGLHQWAKGGNEAPFRSPVPSHIHDLEALQLFSKQFLETAL
jgi:hypothetical protein